MFYYTQQKIFSQQDGFTLVELILVILIIGIAAISVAPRWVGNTMALQSEARRLLDDIRYVQAMSIATGQRYRWVRLSSNTYQLMTEGGVSVRLPNGSDRVTLTEGVSLSLSNNLPNNLIAFNSLGAPYITSTAPGTPLTSAAVISLTSNTQSQNISIAPYTGFGALQ